MLIVASCSHSRESRYEELDKAVAEREQYMQKKEANIANLHHQITPNISLEAKYHICNRIFEEYLAYKADSAQKYLSIHRTSQDASATGSILTTRKSTNRPCFLRRGSSTKPKPF